MKVDPLTVACIFLVVFAVPPIAADPTFAGSGDGPGGFMKVALGESQAAAGIKKALMKSIVDAVRLTGRPNGYFGNPALQNNSILIRSPGAFLSAVESRQPHLHPEHGRTTRVYAPQKLSA